MRAPALGRVAAIVAATAVILGSVFAAALPASAGTPTGSMTLTQTMTWSGGSGTTATVASGSNLTLALNYQCSANACVDSTITVPLGPGLNIGTVAGTNDVLGSSYNGSTGVLTITMVPSIAPGSTGQITVPLSVPAWTTADGTVFSWTSVMSAPGATDADSAVASITAHAGNTLSANTSVASGGAVDQKTVYNLQVCSSGTSTPGYGPLAVAPGSIVTETLPEGATYISSTNGGTESGGVVTWTLGQVTDCPTLSVSVTFASSDPSNITGASKTATVAWSGRSIGDETDGALATNHVTTMLVAPIVSMSFDKWSYTGSLATTQSMTYFITAADNGNVQANTLTVGDNVPTTMQTTSLAANNPSDSTGELWVSSQLGPDDIAGDGDDGELIDAGTIPANSSLNLNPYQTWPSGQAAIGADDIVDRVEVRLSNVPPGSNSTIISLNTTLRTTAFDGAAPDYAGTAVEVGDSITNTADFAYTTGEGPGSDTQSQTVTVAPQIPSLTVRSGGPGQLTFGQTGGTFSVSGSPGSFDLPNPVFVMLLPAGVTVDSWTHTTGTGLPEPTLTTIDDWQGVTGATLLRWTFPDGTVLPVNVGYEFDVDTTLAPHAWGDLTEKGYVSSSSIEPNCTADYFTSGIDTDDKDGDGDTSETLCNWNADIQPVASTSASLSATAQGAYDSAPVDDTAYTTPGSDDDYQVSLNNTGNIRLTNGIVIDRLPRAGDSKMLSSTERNSASQTFPVVLRDTPVVPTLADPVSVYYSTATDPCTPELSYSPSGCDAPGWTTTAPGDLSTVTAVKVDFGNNVLIPYTSWTVDLPVTTPTSGASEPDYASTNADYQQPENDEAAVNSAAFVVESTASSTNLSPTESNSVVFDVPSAAGADGLPPIVTAATSTGAGTTEQTVTIPVPTDCHVHLLDGDGNEVTTLTVDGQGTYTIDPDTGVLTFDPVLGYVGTPDPVPFRVTSVFGDTADSTYTPTVTLPAAPTAPAVAGTGVGTDEQTKTVDVPDGGSAHLLDGDGNEVTTLTVNGQGTYTIDPDTGVLTFDPEPGFLGPADPVDYRVTDAYDQHDDGTVDLTVTIPPAPIAAPVSSTPAAGARVQHVTVDLPDGGTADLVDRDGNPVTTLVVPGQGTYVIDPDTGVLTFTALAGFTGTPTPVEFVVTDSYDQTSDPASYQAGAFVAAGSGGSGSGGSASSGSGSSGGTNGLAYTGITAAPLLVEALLLLAIGLGLLALRLRRRLRTRYRRG
jgi:CshA-type fibril repeat protein